MAQINRHPAPGLGDLLPGFFVVPQNPFQPTTVIPRIGDILPALYAVPQNPLKNTLSGVVRPIGTDPGASGYVNGKPVDGDCGCGGSCGGCGGIGMGDISADLSAISGKISSGDIMGAIQSTVFGIPLWGVLAAVVAIPMVMGKMGGSGGGYRRR